MGRTPTAVARSEADNLVDATLVIPVFLEPVTRSSVVSTTYHPYCVAQRAQATVACWVGDSRGNRPVVLGDVVGPELVEHMHIGWKAPPVPTARKLT
jgi:hypothetical protein